MTDIVFYATFIASRVGATGLTVTVDIDRITRSDGSLSSLVTAGSAAAARNGAYYYRLTGADIDTYDYLTTFKTSASTVLQQNVYALWSSFAPTVPAKTWDEVLTGATHNVPASAGRRLRQLSSDVVFDGLAVSATINTVTFDGDASTVDGDYDPGLISIVGGLGAGQSRLILEYNGATKTATVDRNWRVIPNATSEIIIISSTGREHVNEGLAQGGSTTTITLNGYASDFDNAYNGQVVFIRSGTGEDQAARVTDYDGSTHIASVSPAWAVTPDTTSAYVMLPTAVLTPYCFDQTAAAVWS